MRTALVLTLATISIACQRTTIDDQALSVAQEETLSALRNRDLARLWELSDSATRTALLDGLREVERARGRVAEVWSEADRNNALAALGDELFAKLGPDDPGRGPRLLAATLDPQRLTFDEGTLEGLAPRDVTLDPGPPRRALVLTTAGERFAFLEEGGAWRSLLVRDHVLESASFKSLLEHAAKTNALADEAARLWRTSQDPGTPQGSYNLARAAQQRKPEDLDMLFALLDADARQGLVDVLEAARRAQREIQQRTAKPLRREAYEAAKLVRLVDAASDRELFKKWAASPDWRPLLPATDEPMRQEGELAKGSVVIVTASGAKVPMTRDPDGVWRLGGLRQAITAALGPPAPAAPPTSP